MATGSPGGLEIASNLLPRVWIGAHDEHKLVAGFLTRGILRMDFGAGTVGRLLEDGLWKDGVRGRTEVLSLRGGTEVRVVLDESGKVEPRKSFVKEGVVPAVLVGEKSVVQGEGRVGSGVSDHSSVDDYLDIGS